MLTGRPLTKTQAGFTLLELLVSLAVLVVLLSLAVPGFLGLQQDWRLREQASRVMSAVWLARGLALRSGTTVSLCPSSGSRCRDQDGEGLAVMDDTQRVIRYFPTRPGVKMYNRLGTGPQTAIVRWDAQGLGSRNLTYTLCAPGAERNWSVVLNRLGRPRLVADWGRCPG